MVADVTVRTLAEEECVEGARLVASVMLGHTTDEVAEGWARSFEPGRTHAAVLPDGRPAGLVRWFESKVSFPGGAAGAALVSAVAVSPTHRRQGLLTRMMHAQLAGIVEEGFPVAMLVAAEWPIYGRFGYGPSIEACSWRVDALTARFRDPSSGSIEEVSAPQLRPHLEAMHDARWARTVGAVTRTPVVWDVLAGVAARPGDTDFQPGKWRGAVWRDDAGEVQGAVSYKVKDHWVDSRPRGTAEVVMLVGATAEAERELWRHLCDLDWIATVTADGRPVDEPLRHLLVDGRAAVAFDHWDNIWSRVLDVPGTFGAFRPATERSAVLEVVDPLGYAAGRWRLQLGPDGAEVTTTREAADVRLPVDALGAVHLGGTSPANLHAVGWLDEERRGGVDRVAALFATPTAPWSPTHY